MFSFEAEHGPEQLEVLKLMRHELYTFNTSFTSNVQHPSIVIPFRCVAPQQRLLRNCQLLLLEPACCRRVRPQDPVRSLLRHYIFPLCTTRSVHAHPYHSTSCAGIHNATFLHLIDAQGNNDYLNYPQGMRR